MTQQQRTSIAGGGASFRFWALAAVAFSLLAIAGCGDDEFGKRYSVKGTVKYKGQPVASGTITFDPLDAEKGRSASGTIEQGAYRLSTAGESDGALAGKYRVKIMSRNVDYSQVKANAGGGAGRQTDILKANKAAKDLIPSKYSTIETSGLNAEVKTESNTIDFDLSD
jgi:hypothetical protein